MKFVGIVVLFVTLLLAPQNEARKSYDGYKTYTIIPKHSLHLTVIQRLKEDSSYDFWRAPRRVDKETTVMVPPGKQTEFERTMREYGLEYSVLIDNVEQIVERDMRQSANSRFTGTMNFNQYYRYNDIVAYLNKVAKDYPHLAKASIIGETYEGRDIVGITISSGGNNTRPVIYIEGGIHGREWLAPCSILYIVYQLVEKYESNKALLDMVDWQLVPVSNPDGYEFAHTGDRFWRKNRFFSTPQCKGVDCNRNFGYYWGGAGASSWPCDETYRGSGPFSEAETQALRDFAILTKGRMKLYIALHAYGPYWMYPYGYDYVYPDDWKDLANLAHIITGAINKVNGTVYEIGSSADVLYIAAGGSDDWFKGENDAKYAYTVELPGSGPNGFDPPLDMIFPLVAETWEGIKAGGNYIGTKYGKPKI